MQDRSYSAAKTTAPKSSTPPNSATPNASHPELPATSDQQPAIHRHRFHDRFTMSSAASTTTVPIHRATPGRSTERHPIPPHRRTAASRVTSDDHLLADTQVLLQPLPPPETIDELLLSICRLPLS
ncbi:uncharacterized protein K460DRAFT_89112 [Cucurbitaria berberidis CBS 394.84]|uniref:Uncharacterized protein n=1 Tax=Cucurbitaria berberidis CBS 394.84 TaxID=1168544 RepID=A0A9P4GQK2_9PLEO|nr:uncharacterized protein K460DRAFT_89112 [Cucurbitaria berberidis CBS 394.84]KAF1849326.1 hypothetical protein K460DRAFT_89112 [Cucurbitaria berberidis CBS 394.84]